MRQCGEVCGIWHLKTKTKIQKSIVTEIEEQGLDLARLGRCPAVERVYINWKQYYFSEPQSPFQSERVFVTHEI